MKPARPATIRILGKDWTIEPMSAEAQSMADSCTFGTCLYGEQRLIIRPRTKVSVAISTLLHEILHAINDTQSAGLTEHQVELMEASLYAVLADNGADCEWLAAPLRKARLI